MKSNINKLKLNEMKESQKCYWNSFSNFKKLDKKEKNNITRRMIKDDSKSSVEIESENNPPCFSCC